MSKDLSCCQQYEYQDTDCLALLVYSISLFCLFLFSVVVCITPSIPVALWVLLMLLSSWVLDLISRDLPTEEAQQGSPCFDNERADKAKT